MSHAAPSIARRLRGISALLLAHGLLLGCPKPDGTDTERPDGPSEAAELPASAVIDAGMAEGADEAAKQAAAQEVLKKVKDRDPEEEKKKMARSKAVSAEARGKLARGNQAEAIQGAREALKLHEQNVDAMLVIAEAYYKQRKFELVYAVTTSALQVDAKIRTPEESSRAYNLQGFAMLGMGEGTKATQAFKKAAEVDDKNASAWNNLGTRYLAAGDVPTATSCFQYALELDPRFPQAQLNYGAALRAQGKWEEAETAIRKALELRANWAEAYFNLGVLYLDADPFPGLDTTQRLNKAIQNLGKYRELAIADASASATTKGPGIGGNGKAPPPPVSKERADDYIRVAKKGLDREARRLEREKTKSSDPAGGDAAAPATPASGDAPPSSPDEGAPEQPIGDDGATEAPAPQGPGTEPSKPEPSKPAPQGPGTEPSKPEPSKPAPQGPAAPSKPEPIKPAPQGPAAPTPTPVKPAPQGPAAPTPTPVKPAPQGPAAPTPTPVQPAPPGPTPTPVKPAPQQPKASAVSDGAPAFEEIHRESASRGTRSLPSTLNTTVPAEFVPRTMTGRAHELGALHGHPALARPFTAPWPVTEPPVDPRTSLV